jgi:hypothetical protein
MCSQHLYELVLEKSNLLVDEHDKKYSTCLVGRYRKTGGVVEAKEVKDATNDEVGHLRNNETSGERRPMVHLRLLLSCLVNVSALDE